MTSWGISDTLWSHSWEQWVLEVEGTLEDIVSNPPFLISQRTK